MKRVISPISQHHSRGKGAADFLAERRCPGEGVFLADDGAKGHRLDPRQRESSINQLLTAEFKLLRCPQVEENARTCALFSIYPQRTRKSWTAWRRGADSNPRDASGFEGRNSTRVWRTIRPEQKHPCWREFVRLGFGSSSELLRYPSFARLTRGIWLRRTSDQGLEFESPPPGRVYG